MSIFNPVHFDYLKIEANGMRNDLMTYTYPLTCVKNDTVAESFNVNSNWTLNFDVYNDNSAGFANLDEQSIIWAGDQPFAVQTYAKKSVGVSTASVTASHYAYSEFKRLVQPKQLSYDPDASVDTSSSSSNKFYCNLTYLLTWFFDGIDQLRFQYNPQTDIHGHFPVRPLAGLSSTDSKITGEQLINVIKQTWPGVYIIPDGFHLTFWGYAQWRDNAGNPVNVADLDTGLRFDSLAGMNDLTIEHSRSSMCNAILVRSATYTVQQQSSDDDDDDSEQSSGNEYVFNQQPYFPDMLVVSENSINKYGLYYDTKILDDGYTSQEAAISGAREKMVTQPVLKVTGTVHTPGRTPEIPAPGRIYTIGDTQENQIYRVKVTGFTWHKDPTKGLQLTLSSIDPGVVGILSSKIVHDLHVNPQLTDFKAVDPQKTQDVNAQTVNADASSSRANDRADGTSDNDLSDGNTSQTGTNDGQGNGNQGAGQDQAQQDKFLPIFDKPGKNHAPQALISSWGNVLLNQNQRRWYFRITDDDSMNQVVAGKLHPKAEDDKRFQHVASMDMNHYSINSITTDHGEHHQNKDKHSFYAPVDTYLGSTLISDTGLIATQGNQITLRAHAGNQDLSDKGFYRRSTYKSDDGKKLYTHDINPSGWDNDKDLDNTKWGHVDNPGVLATVQCHQIGSRTNPIKAVYSRFIGSNNRKVTNSWFKHLNADELFYENSYQVSQLSKKENVKPLSHGLSKKRLMSTRMYSYNYKEDKDKNYQASVVIDDINDDPKYQTPREYMNADKTGRNDAVILADAVNVIQMQQKKIEELENRLDKLENA